MRKRYNIKYLRYLRGFVSLGERNMIFVIQDAEALLETGPC